MAAAGTHKVDDCADVAWVEVLGSEDEQDVVSTHQAHDDTVVGPRVGPTRSRIVAAGVILT